eukprot:scaffold2546_cov118-Isochrysis_galbana.AAC.3
MRRWGWVLKGAAPGRKRRVGREDSTGAAHLEPGRQDGLDQVQQWHWQVEDRVGHRRLHVAAQQAKTLHLGGAGIQAGGHSRDGQAASGRVGNQHRRRAGRDHALENGDQIGREGVERIGVPVPRLGRSAAAIRVKGDH